MPDFKICEKYKLISDIAKNPQEIKGIIKNSIFYDSTNGYNDRQFRLGILSLEEFFDIFNEKYMFTYVAGEYINIEKYDENRDYSGNSITYIDSKIIAFKTYTDAISINYVGKENEKLFKNSLSFYFKSNNNNWRLTEIALGKNIFLASSKNDVFPKSRDTIIFENIKFIRQSKDVNNLCNMISKIKIIMNDPIEAINYFSYEDNNFPKNGYDTNNVDYMSLFDYLYKFKDNYLIFLVYPFPIDDSDINKYLNNVKPKQYFILRNMLDTSSNISNKYITFEFTCINYDWYLTDIFRGIDIYLYTRPIDAFDEPPMIEPIRKK